MGKLVLDLVKGLTWSEEKYIFFFPFLKQITKTVPPWCRIQKKVVPFLGKSQNFLTPGPSYKATFKIVFFKLGPFYNLAQLT